MNRFNIKYTGHYNPWLTQGINHFKCELGHSVKGSYHDPNCNAIYESPKGESFGICPIADFYKEFLGMVSFNSRAAVPGDPAASFNDNGDADEDADAVVDHSFVSEALQLCALPMVKAKKLVESQYVFLARSQNVKYPVVPIHTEEERKLFWIIYGDLSMHEEGKQDFVEMAKEWCRRCNVTNERTKKTIYYYKTPELLESFLNIYEHDSIFSSSSKLSQNAEKIKIVKDALKPSSRPVPPSFLPAILPMPLMNNPPAPSQSLKRKRSSIAGIPISHLPSSKSTTTIASTPIANMSTTTTTPIGSATIATPSAKKSRKCTRCSYVDPENMLNCPGKQVPKNCKHYISPASTSNTAP